MYAIRRVRDSFRANKSLSSSSEIDSAFSEGKSSLETLKRQALISNLYSAEKLVIEKNRWKIGVFIQAEKL